MKLCKNCKYSKKRFDGKFNDHGQMMVWTFCYAKGANIQPVSGKSFTKCIDKNIKGDCADYERSWWRFWA